MSEPELPITKYEYATVKLASLVDSQGLLSDTEFHHCTIEGPAILRLLPNAPNKLIHCRFDIGSPEAMFWVFTPGRNEIGGVVALSNVSFIDSALVNIGFAVHEEEIPQYMEGIDPDGRPV